MHVASCRTSVSSLESEFLSVACNTSWAIRRYVIPCRALFLGPSDDLSQAVAPLEDEEALLAMDDIERYSLGSERDLSAFEEMCGVDFTSKVIVTE